MNQGRTEPFDLQLDCEFLRIGRKARQEFGRTKNLSSKGAQIAIQTKAEVGDRVEFKITLLTTARMRVKIHCRGQVIRRDDFEVVVSIKRYSFERSPSKTTANGEVQQYADRYE